jgi:hypothetical protein
VGSKPLRMSQTVLVAVERVALERIALETVEDASPMSVECVCDEEEKRGL